MLLICIMIFYIIIKFKKNPPFPIDIVYTWTGENEDNENIRLSNNNELKYSLRSVIKFMPWVNKIYILMNNPKKIPSWFNSKYSNKIIIYDHTDTFPKTAKLPNKNSNAIETTLCNIPGLSEHFIYMNDDFFIGKEVYYYDFFTKDGKVKISENVNDVNNLLIEDKKDILKINYPLISNRKSYPHLPIPFIKSYFKKFIFKYKNYITWIRQTNVRLNNFSTCNKYNLKKFCQQIHYPILIYLNENNKVTTIKKKKFVYVDKRSYYKLCQILKNPPYFFCINDGNKYSYKIINDFLDKMYPKKCYFEK